MSRTVILSQKQINEIIGEEAFSYFNGSNSNFREYPSNEVSADSSTTDIIAQTLSDKNNSLWKLKSDGKRGGIPSTLTCSKEDKKKILESNKSLEGRFYKLSPTMIRVLRRRYEASKSPDDSKGKMTLSNILNNGGVTYTDATTIKSRMDKLKPTSEEYKELGGRQLHRFLNMSLSNSSELIKRDKENNINLGLDNAFQKKGGTKNNGGKAHTPKNGNIIVR